jgi:hypothetical protein
MFRVLGDLDYYSITGLDDENVLLSSEWKLLKANSISTAPTRDAENDVSETSYTALAAKQQLQNRVLGDDVPVSVLKANSIRDYNRIFEAGMKVGNGSEADWAEGRKLMDRMAKFEEPLQKEILKLSGLGRFVKVETGHNVPLTRPDVIVEEVRWVLEMVRAKKMEKS